MIRLTIDGREVRAREGASILEAALSNGIDIPRLCHIEGLPGLGSCRLCLVEIDGRPPVTSCTTVVAEGMNVVSENERLASLRHLYMELILTEHPTACLFCADRLECPEHHGTRRKTDITTGCRFCPKDGSCELQALAERIGLTGTRLPGVYRDLPVRRDDPFIDRDYNLCVLCSRCVRVCEETRGASAITLVERGMETRVGTGFDLPLLKTTCQFCGLCAEVCPTGSISDRIGRWDGPADETVESACPYCSLACGIAHGKVAGRIVRTTGGSSGHPSGLLCVKGRYGTVEFIRHHERVLEPMVRKDGRLGPVSWEEALDAAADLVRSAGSLSVMGDPDLTGEAMDALLEYAGKNDVFLDTGIVTMEDLAPAVPPAAVLDADWILAVATDARFREGIADLLVRRAREGGARLIVMEIVENDLSRIANERIRLQPGEIARSLKEIERPGGKGVVLLGPTATALDEGREILDALHRLDAGIVYLFDHPNLRGAAERFLPPPRTLPGRVGGALHLLGIPRVLPEAEGIILQSLFLGPLEEKVDIFLPAAGPGEIDGTFTAPSGEIVSVRLGSRPPGKAMSDEWILGNLSMRLDGFDSPSATGRDAAVEGAAGGGAAVEGAAAPKMMPPDTLPPISPSAEGTVLLFREPSPFKFRGHPLGDYVPGLASLAGDGVMRLSMEDAERLGVSEGDEVKVSGERFIAWIEPRLPEGVASMTEVPGERIIGGPNPMRVEVARCTV